MTSDYCCYNTKSFAFKYTYVFFKHFVQKKMAGLNRQQTQRNDQQVTKAVSCHIQKTDEACGQRIGSVSFQLTTAPGHLQKRNNYLCGFYVK